MTLEQLLNYFQKKYPGKRVIMSPEKNPTEVICEIEPSSEHQTYSVALAGIKSSRSHFHQHALEEYDVLQGPLMMRINDEVRTLYDGDHQDVRPRQIHSAESISGFALVRVTSRPGWRQDDHIVADQTTSG